MKKILFALAVMALAAPVMAKETEKELYVKVQLNSSEKDYGYFNMYAAFEEEGASGSGVVVIAPAGRRIRNVNVSGESFFNSTVVCGVIDFHYGDKTRSSAKVKVFELEIDDGMCPVEVVLDNGEVHKLVIQSVGT